MSQSGINMKQGGFIKVKEILSPGSRLTAIVWGPPHDVWLSAVGLNDEGTCCIFNPNDVYVESGNVVFLEIEEMNVPYRDEKVMVCRLVEIISIANSETI